MSTNKHYTQYDEESKRTIVNLHQNGNNPQATLCKEYGISQTALTRWFKQYSTVQVDDDEVLTTKQSRDIQKRDAQFEEENHILKRRLPSSRHTQTTISAVHKLRFQHAIKTFLTIVHFLHNPRINIIYLSTNSLYHIRSQKQHKVLEIFLAILNTHCTHIFCNFTLFYAPTV